jgi:hypothetical protein
MELGPISGIRSVTLPQARRAEKDNTPLFVIDASARAGDDPGSSDQQSSGRDPDNALEEQAADAVELAAAETENATTIEPDLVEKASSSGHDWFV